MSTLNGQHMLLKRKPFYVSTLMTALNLLDTTKLAARCASDCISSQLFQAAMSHFPYHPNHLTQVIYLFTSGNETGETPCDAVEGGAGCNVDPESKFMVRVPLMPTKPSVFPRPLNYKACL